MSTSLDKAKDIWFPDGNVIIRVGDRVCRAYQGFLASQSPVLADMFSIPQPTDGVDMMDGLPVVTFPDPPEEVTHWLRAMLLPGNFEAYPRKVEDSQLLAVLRLSHKYDVQYLRRRALEHLAAQVPVDVQGFKDSHDEIMPQTMLDEDQLVYFLRVNAIAHEVGALWLIPSVIYELHHTIDDDPCTLDNLSAEISPLTIQLVVRLYKISHLITQQFSLARLVMCQDCNRQPPCGAAKPIVQNGWDEELHYNPVCFYFGLESAEAGKDVTCTGKGFEDNQGLCNLCRLVLRGRHARACADFWNALPQSLGLPAWTDLLATKASDLGDVVER